MFVVGTKSYVYEIVGRTPLHYAAQNGLTEAAKTLIAHGKVDINQKDTDGCTALLLAADSNHTSLVRLLLVKGAKQIPNKSGATPLLTAAAQGKLDLVKVLIRIGGSELINIAGSDPKQFINLTPLLVASAELHEEVVLYMLNQ